MSPTPKSERSDWTDLDLLTLDEAAPRLAEAIAQAEAELDTIRDPTEREQAAARIAGMQAIQERWQRLHP
jgi:hypothetical protein